MKKKKVKRLIASALAVAMCFTMATTMSFANVGKSALKKNSEINIVSFGDSTSNGYEMPDYYKASQGFSTNNNYLDDWGDMPHEWTSEKAWTRKAAAEWNEQNPDKLQGRMSEFAYPWRLKKYIMENEGVEKVNLIPFNLNGIRTNELRAYLDEDFYEKRSKQEYAYAQEWLEKNYPDPDTRPDIQEYKGFFNAHVDDYTRSFYNCGAISEYKGKEGYRQASNFVQESIKNADIILVDVCGNNFGTSLAWRILSLGNDSQFKIYVPNGYETLDDIDGLPDGLKKKLNSVLKMISSVPAVKENPTIKALLEAIVFCVADCFVNYSADIEWIMQNKKPNAKVITVGVTNQMTDMVMEKDGKTINFGDYAGLIYDAANEYVRAIDKNAKNIYYADPPKVLTSYYTLIHNAESFDALMNDGEYKDGLGRYAIELATKLTITDFFGQDEKSITPEYRTAIQKMLYKAIHDYSDKFTKPMIMGGTNWNEVIKQLTQYLNDIMQGKESEAQMDEDVWGAIVEAVRSFDEVAIIHPSAVGCTEKYDAVLKAYLSNKTAYKTFIEDMLIQLHDLSLKLKEAIKSKDFQKIRNKLEPIKEKLTEMRMAVFSDDDLKAALRKCVDLIRKAREGEKNPPKENNNSPEKQTNPTQKPANANDNTSKKSTAQKVTLAKAKITSLKKGKKSFVVKWKKVAKADGYQISYKTGKTKKIAKVAGVNKLSKKVTKLKAKKKYIVKVRAYKKVSGKMYYGKWSKAKKVTTK